MKQWQTLQILAVFFSLFTSSVLASIVTLNQDQPDGFVFESTNTYVLTNQVFIDGTATLMPGTVLKFGRNSSWPGTLVVENIDCQTEPANPATFTSVDDDGYGDVLPQSTHSPSGFYPTNAAALAICNTNDVFLHDVRFYYSGTALDFSDLGDADLDVFHLSNAFMQDVGLGIYVENGGNLSISNLTMIDCGGLADGFDVRGSAVDSTFMNSGFVEDSWSYFFNGFNFSWCVFSNNSLDSFELDISGDHNGFYNCGTFSDYDMNSGWYSGTNYFGTDWYWLTNSVIRFYLLSTNNYLRSSNAPTQVHLSSGTVFYKAILVNNTNFDDAVWTEYTASNLDVNLGSLSNGNYAVRVGLYGARDYAPVWRRYDFTLDTNVPQIFITNPTNRVISQPIIQLTGYGSEEMVNYSYDLSNSVTVVTNRFVSIVNGVFDTNVWKTTANYFQCYDLQLAPGTNNITLYATGHSGITGRTNITLIVDYSSRTNPPVIQEDWPQDGDYLSGDTFMINGTLDDPTTAIVATIVNASGQTNNVGGLVGRDGKYYIHNVPLSDGTNLLALTATDVVGLTTTTNLTVIKSAVVIHTFPVTVEGGNIIVSGTLNTNNYTVWVNGVQATIDGNNWSATIPMFDRHGGTVDVKAVPNGGGQ